MDTPNATKSRSGRPGWSVIFRHPLRRDARGRPGLRIRRGLNTSDDAQADGLVTQLNLLLADRSWWSADRRAEAEQRFAPAIVSAFFDGIESGRPDTLALRDAHLPFPGRDAGYARIHLVGTTGAGKTTLLRHLIGTSHERDRFPSTSTAKTTIADTEIITADGPFRAVVTFMSEFEVRAHIDECIEAACLEAVESRSDDKVAAAFLTHREQRFRLSYLLGDLSGGDVGDAEPEDEFSFEPATRMASEIPDAEAVSEAERRANRRRLAELIADLRGLAEAVEHEIEAEHGPLSAQDGPEPVTAWLEGFSDRLFEHEGFSRLSLDIRDEVEGRFERLTPEHLTRSSSGWPTLWVFESRDRDAFLSQVRWFSSNHHRQFGRLLTPLVDGIRVRGPFRPAAALRVADRLVLIDGQGIGHSATESLSSLSTRITTRLAEADLVLLVDSAQQPMLAAPLSLLRMVGSAGYADKAMLCFTHFDQVKGDNLHTTAQKRAHVLDSLANGIAGLRQLLGASVATGLERRLEERTFLVGGLDREVGAIPTGVIKELQRLLAAMQAAAGPERSVEVAPVYNLGGLELALRDAVDAFLRPWEARLGLAYRDGIRVEHWSRVKALARRLGNLWGDEYDTLRPAGDLIGRLQEEISRWLDSPAGWSRMPRDDDERLAALNPIRAAVFTALHALVGRRLSTEQRASWLAAYEMSGRYSGFRRAVEIRQIYENSAPPMSSAMKPAARAFLAEVVDLVRAGIESKGGRIELPGAGA